MNINRDKHNKYVVNWTPTIPASTADTSTSSSGNNTIIYVSGGGSSSGGETVVPSTEESFAYYSISDGTNTVIQAASIPKDTAYLTLIGDDNINVTVVTESSIPEQEFVSTGTNTGTYKVSYLKVVTIPETPEEPEPEEPADPVTQADEEPTEPVTPEPVTTYPLTLIYVSGDKIQTALFDTLRLYKATVENETETKAEVKNIAATDLTIEGDTTGVSSITVDVGDIDFNRVELTITSTTEVEGELVTQTVALLSFNVKIQDKNTVYVKSNFNVEQYWKLDKDGNLYTDYNAYSTKELSAYGLGSSEENPEGGAQYLYQLRDVDKDTALTPADKGILQYNATKKLWEVTDGSDIKPDLTGYATQEWVTTQVTNYINQLKGNAPENMDTLGEIAGVINTVQEKLSSLEILLEWFEWDNTNQAIKALFDLYGVGEISAYGYGSGETEPSASYLRELKDVDLTNLKDDGILLYNSSTQLWEVTDGSNLRPDLTGYATLSWVGTLISTAITNLIGGAPEEFDTLGEIATAILRYEQILDWFSFVDGKIRANYDLWSVGEVSAYGAGESGETGGKNYLHELEDVSITPNSLTAGQLLQYNGTVWVAIDKDEVGLNETELAAYLTRNNYLQEGDVTWSNLPGKPTTFNTTITLITDLPDQWETLLTNNPTDYITRWPAFSEVTNKPTTLEGYGITDAFTKNQADDRYVNITGDTMTGDLLLPNLEASGYVMIGSAVLSYDTVNKALKLATASGGLLNFYATGEVSAYGMGSSVLELEDMADVLITDVTVDLVLVWNGEYWVNSDPTGGINEEQLEQYLLENNYALLSDIPSLTGYATLTWVNNLLEDYVLDVYVNDSVYSPNSSGRVTLPDYITRYSVDSDGTLVISTNIRLKDNSNFGQYLYFGDGSYVYLAELTDDDLTIHATDLNLDVSRLLLNGEEVTFGVSNVSNSGSGNIVSNITASGDTLNVTKTYTINTAASSGRLAYYNDTTTIDDYSSSVGTSTRLWYLNSGVPTNSTATVGSTNSPVYLSSGTLTACTYDLNGNLNAGVAGRLAYYSSANAIDDYTSTVGSGTRMWYLNAGTPTNSSSTIGSNYIPVWLSSGTITASSLDFMVERGILGDTSSNWNNILTPGMYTLAEWGTNGPTSSGYLFGTVAVFKSGTTSYGGAVTLLYFPHSNNGAGIYAAFRTTYLVSSSRWTNWHYILDTGNYASFLNNYYVRKTGDNMTGNLTFNSGEVLLNNGWFRNSSSNQGLYNVAKDKRWYANSAGYWFGDAPVLADAFLSRILGTGFWLGDNYNYGRFFYDSGTNAVYLQGTASGRMKITGRIATRLSLLTLYASTINLSTADSLYMYIDLGDIGVIGGSLAYILLTKAYYSGSTINGGTCLGFILADRGSTATWNGKTIIEVSCGGDYNTNVANWRSLGGSWVPTSMCVVRYNSEYYIAMKLAAGSSYNFRFLGYSDMKPIPIKSSSATEITTITPQGSYFGGSIISRGEVTAYQSSDIRLKTNITDLKSLDYIRKMRPVEYDWTDKALELKTFGPKHGYGLIAQELEQIVPDLVTHNMFSEGYLGIDYTRLVPFTISAIKEVDDEVTKLKKRVKELEKKVSKYERLNGLRVAGIDISDIVIDILQS